jgi:hypothetical protein
MEHRVQQFDERQLKNYYGVSETSLLSHAASIAHTILLKFIDSPEPGDSPSADETTTMLQETTSDVASMG